MITLELQRTLELSEAGSRTVRFEGSISRLGHVNLHLHTKVCHPSHPSLSTPGAPEVTERPQLPGKEAGPPAQASGPKDTGMSTYI